MMNNFDCGSDVEMVEDINECENDSDLDSQIVQIWSWKMKSRKIFRKKP